MNREELLNIILDYLKQKGMLSDLEKDILSTLKKYTENPFDRESSERKIMENNCRYPDVLNMIGASLGRSAKPFNELLDEEIHNTLYLQIEAMWVKNIQQQSLKKSD